MKKSVYKIFLYLLMLVLALGFTACKNEKNDSNDTKHYTLTINGGMGGGTFNEKTQVTATATIPSGKKFIAWFDGETLISAENPYVFILSKDLTLIAMFKDIDGLEKETVELVMTGLSYDYPTKTISWNKVENASGYALRIGNNDKEPSLITESGDKMLYIMDEENSGNYLVYVKALGSETTTLIYANSAEERIKISYISLSDISAEEDLQIRQLYRNLYGPRLYNLGITHVDQLTIMGYLGAYSGTYKGCILFVMNTDIYDPPLVWGGMYNNPFNIADIYLSGHLVISYWSDNSLFQLGNLWNAYYGPGPAVLFTEWLIKNNDMVKIKAQEDEFISTYFVS